MLYELITSAFLDRRYTGRFRGLRGPGRPRTNWRSTVNKNLLRMGITWEETNLAANITDQNGVGVWPNCIHLHAGWIKVKVNSVHSIFSSNLESADWWNLHRDQTKCKYNTLYYNTVHSNQKQTSHAKFYKKALPWQGEPRDAAVNFDTYRILQ